MKKNKKVTICTIAAIMAIANSMVICSAANWGDLGTVTINSSDGWKSQFDGPYDTKETDSGKFGVYSTAKTMTSSPSVRLINSNNEVRSGSVTISDTGRQFIGDNNTGSIGYNYWTQTKPAWNQVGSDTMRYQVNADHPDA